MLRNFTTFPPFFFFLKAFNPSSESKSAKKENFDKKEPKKYEIAQKKNVPLEVDWKITLFARSSPSAGSSKYSAKKSDKEWQTFFKDLTLSNFYEGN